MPFCAWRRKLARGNDPHPDAAAHQISRSGLGSDLFQQESNTGQRFTSRGKYRSLPVFTQGLTMSVDFVCWKCGFSVDARMLSYRRLEQCGACEAELHVCRMCAYFSPRLPGGCSEDRAEEVMNKERANFCDYFTPRRDAFAPHDGASGRRAKADLEALFGQYTGSPASESGDGDAPSAHRKRLDDLFEN